MASSTPFLTSDLVQDGSVDLQGKPVIRSRTGGWKASTFIIGVELVERLAYYGVATNLITYLTTVLHEGTSSSAKNTNNWSGVTTVSPFIGAFLADACWGRYWTIVIASVVYVMGLSLLTLSVSLKMFRPPPCTSEGLYCQKASASQLGFFFFSLYSVSLGTACIKPCLQAFGADQFDDTYLSEKLKKNSFFNWWYFGLCIGALLASSVLVYIQDNVSWGLGFGIPAGAMVLALLIFLLGTPHYRHKLPSGSPLRSIADVLLEAIRYRGARKLYSDNLPYETMSTNVNWKGAPVVCIARSVEKPGTEESSTLDSERAIISPTFCNDRTDMGPFVKDAAENGANFKERSVGTEQVLNLSPPSTNKHVEEAKLLLNVMPIWLSTLAYGIVFAQVSTFFTKQGSMLDRKIGPNFKIPPACLQTFTPVAILLMLPVYDRILVPKARQLTGNERGVTLLQRIGIGLFLSILSMTCAALAEVRRLRLVKDLGLTDKPDATVPLSIFWLLPQYALFGIADVFTIVGQQEFFYDQVPDNMRSIGGALFMLANGSGSFLSSLLITIIDSSASWVGHKSWFVNNLNECHLDYFYWLLAAISTLNLGMYMVVAHFYTYKKTDTAT